MGWTSGRGWGKTNALIVRREREISRENNSSKTQNKSYEDDGEEGGWGRAKCKRGGEGKSR